MGAERYWSGMVIFMDYVVMIQNVTGTNRSSKEPFLLLKEISTQCLEDIRKGKTGTVKQLLTLLSGVKQ